MFKKYFLINNPNPPTSALRCRDISLSYIASKPIRNH